MKAEKPENGHERFVDFLIESLSIGVLIIGAVMVGVSWRGWDGPNVGSALLLLTGAVLFAGHNICLYLEDCSSDLTQSLQEVRETVARLEQNTKPTKSETAGK